MVSKDLTLHDLRYNFSLMSSRRRYIGNRNNTESNRCVGEFGVCLCYVFGKYGFIEDVQVVYDAQSGRSSGFAFVYFEDADDDKIAKERCSVHEIEERIICVDFSITERAHIPIYEIYVGKPTYINLAIHMKKRSKKKY
ncbi:hypothetical protein CEXT_599771 [Caerostris extrusa]|uniref:RRM domain-containing protein n=1 Tax=Caerostris extrusa TaxID=172846 RepID=A0AAV4RIT4_CAEEX|nr:hypothetical protein CEXT_599771 [Caerostris extrusa]